MTEYFLISESLVGAHLVEEQNSDEKITTYSISIPINTKFNETTKKYDNNTNVIKMSEFVELISDYKIAKSNGHEVYFLLGFDGDAQGEYMSSVLREELIKNGVELDKIYRTPFFDDNYITICNFKNIDDFLFYHGLNQDFMNLLKNKKLPVLSIKQALAINKLVTMPKNKELQVINNAATNTFTFITNSLNSKKV